jgi:DNA-binding MarR family transcriptional regulator
MMNDATPDRMETWLLFLRAHTRVIEQLAADIEATHHLPLTWYDVLVQLDAASGQRLRLQELSGMLALSASGLSRRVARMEDAGLVRREPCPEDKRGVFVELTACGEQQLHRAAPIHLQGIEALFTRHLTDEENRAMHQALAKILAAPTPTNQDSRHSPTPGA